MARQADAVVVGSGPNGLAAAIALARVGLRVRVHEAQQTIGGGLRSGELTLPGYVHDLCSAVHPLAVASPFLSGLGLCRHGLRWVHPEIPLAHPLEDGTAVALHRSLEDTAQGLGGDAGAYRRLITPFAERFAELIPDLLRPALRLPRHPVLLARFGLFGGLPQSWLKDAFELGRSRALFAGLAAHAILPLGAPLTSSFSLLFAAAAHAVGWPLAAGGSQRIGDALAALLKELGGELVTSSRVDTLQQAGEARAYLLDTTPQAMGRIAGERLPERYRRTLARFRRGPGVFKVDYALSAPVPWRAEACRRAGTVHVGGAFAQIAQSEADVARGLAPERPFVLVSQPTLFDPTRAPPGRHVLWAYCHVPNGSTLDMTGRIEAQLERFAPGFRDVVLARTATPPAGLEARNPNCVGGDISGGSNSGLQLFGRPRLAADPYATPASDLYLCSASTPPGAGVHGMCGYHAAMSALRRSFR